MFDTLGLVNAAGTVDDREAGTEDEGIEDVDMAPSDKNHLTLRGLRKTALRAEFIDRSEVRLPF